MSSFRAGQPVYHSGVGSILIGVGFPWLTKRNPIQINLKIGSGDIRFGSGFVDWRGTGITRNTFGIGCPYVFRFLNVPFVANVTIIKQNNFVICNASKYKNTEKSIQNPHNP